MSGYRTIYREGAKCNPTGEKIPLWGAAFSPSSRHRFVVASSNGIALRYELQESSSSNKVDRQPQQQQSADLSTAGSSGMVLNQTCTYGANSSYGLSLGCTAVSVVENEQGEEIVAFITLHGHVRLYYCMKSNEVGDAATADSTCFTVDNATGNNIALLMTGASKAIIVAVGCIDGSVKIFTVIEKGSASLDYSMGQGNSCVMSLSWSPNGHLVAVGRKDGIVDVYSSPTAADTTSTSHHTRVVHHMVAHSSIVRAVAFSPDGALLLTGGDDGRVHAYDIMRHKVALVGTFVGHKSWILGISWSPNSSTFATCSADKTVKIWDTSTRQIVHTFDGHLDMVWSVAFSPCGSRLVSCGDDGIIQVYSCEQ